MLQNPHVATGKFCTLNDKNNLADSWDELMLSLNNLRNPGVKEKKCEITERGKLTNTLF